MAAPWLVCATATCSRAPLRRAPSGIRTFPIRSTSVQTGRMCRTTWTFDNGFKVQWELFLRHVAEDAPFRWTLLEGAKGVQLAELGLKSWKERCWVDVPKLSL